MTSARAMPAGHASDLRGKRVIVVGLGRFGGGIGVTRWLCSQGAIVTVSDKAPSEELADSIRALDGCPVALRLGGHDERDFLDADLLVVSPAVPKEIPTLAAALREGVPHTTEMNLFLERCPAKVIGVTGSVGKSTTTAMLGEVLARRFTTHVGGNIGRSLLGDLDRIAAGDLVVLEMSSFQLEDTPAIRFSPHVAIVTNLSHNHLDRHGTMEVYAAAKKNIFRFQTSRDLLVLNADCPIVSRWGEGSPGQVRFFRAADEPFELAVPGRHNQADAQAAWRAASWLGVDRAEAAEALRAFRGLPHRLQFVTEREGVRYYNDSKCTTPEGAIVAVESFEPRRAVVIAGGYDKGADFSALGAALAQRAKAVVALGATREKIVSAVEAHRRGPEPVVETAADLTGAVSVAGRLAGPGDLVLLSPACASYDMFRNYEHRGDTFVRLATGP